MQRSKFDDRLQILFTRSAERVTHYAPIHPRATPIKALVEELLAGAPAAHAAAVEAVIAERRDSFQAGQGVRAAEEVAEGVYEPLYHTIQSALYGQLARDRSAGQQLQEEASRTLGAWSPSVFRALGLDRTVNALEQVIAFADRLLPAEEPLLVEARQALQGMREARARVDRESSEGIEAFKALEAARDAARLEYMAARRLLQAAFLLDGRDDLQRFMPALHANSKPAQGEEPSPSPTAEG